MRTRIRRSVSVSRTDRKDSISATIILGWHLFRVTVAGDVLSLAMDKDKKDPASKGEVLGKETITLKPGEWWRCPARFTGDTAKVTCGGKTISGTHANREREDRLSFVQGASVSFDDVTFTSTK